MLVAEVDGDIVGTVTLYPDASTIGFGWPAGWAAIRALAVDPAWRGTASAGGWSRRASTVLGTPPRSGCTRPPS